MSCDKLFLKAILITIIFLTLCEARGGRRGGSFGGLFGSWRKYKKPSSGGGSSRRIVSSSPIHTPITKAWHENKKAGNSDKFQKNIKPNNMYYGSNTPPLPTGGAYYQTTAALPGNAIYIAQAPPRGSESGDFLTGYLTARLLTMGFPTAHYHVERIHMEAPFVAENPVQKSKALSTAELLNTNSSLEASTIRPFYTTLTEFSTTTESSNLLETRNASTDIAFITTTPPTPPYGIICVPMMMNETNSFGVAVQNNRTVCYPAPVPPSPQKAMKPVPVEIAGDITEH